MDKYKHLNLDERYAIQHGMDIGAPFKEIGRDIARDCRTIAREVTARSTITETGGGGKHFNNCANRGSCTVTKLKTSCDRKKKCSLCFECCPNSCSEFSRDVCPELQKPPYCCNPCKNRSKCTLSKMIYSAVRADKTYRKVRSEANSGIYADEEEIARINKIVSPIIKNGQSIHHICINHLDELMISEKTLYNYVNMGLLDARNIDMPRKVRYKPRKCKLKTLKVDKRCREGRTLVDMNRFVVANDPAVVEMDTVEGRKGGKVLLTLFFTLTNLMLSFIRDANTAFSVKKIFNDLYGLLQRELFMKLFAMLMGDNGAEFSDPLSIEFDEHGDRRTWVFFCDPNAPWQKSCCELNHEFVRRVLPKGVSFDHLSQQDVQLMMDHINSYKRPSLGDRSPYELFVSVYGQEAADRLGLTLIPYDDIILKPSLLKKEV